MTPFASTSRTVSLAVSIIGGLSLAGIALSAFLDSNASGGLLFGAESSEDSGASAGSTLTESASGVSTLSVDSSASAFTLQFGDVAEATLDIEGEGRYRWTLERDGDELEVESRQRFGDFCLFGCFAGNERVTLTLPEELEGRLDADLSVSAGALSASGSFRGVDLEVGAGRLDFEGSARSLSAEISAGAADITAADVEEASFSLSAGRGDIELTGEAPKSVELDVSAGRISMTLPDVAYDVSEDVSAGSLENELQTSSRSEHRISADVSAGSASLTPGSGR